LSQSTLRKVKNAEAVGSTFTLTLFDGAEYRDESQVNEGEVGGDHSRIERFVPVHSDKMHDQQDLVDQTREHDGRYERARPSATIPHSQIGN
jgi:hypothetical protein